MKKIVRLSESDLERLIQRVVLEQNQTASQSYQQGKTTGQAAGQQARQAVNKVASEVFQGAKQVVITIGKTVITVILMAGYTIYLIAKGYYKVGMAIHNAIVKFLSASGKAVIKAATAVEQKSIDTLNSMKVGFEKGKNFVLEIGRAHV